MNKWLSVGDLIKVNQSIPEYVDVRGETTGVIVGETQGTRKPRCFEILWSDSEFESLYEDEIEHA